MLGDKESLEKCSQISRLVIAGNLISSQDVTSQVHHYKSRQQATIVLPIKDVDIWLSEILRSSPVDIMPGSQDPANYTMPQQPFNKYLFPGASKFQNLNRCTNPHYFEADNVKFLGTSGQNIEDIAQYVQEQDSLKLMEYLLKWRHLAPSCPDTLACYPFYNQDPFILEESPNVVFLGNQNSFSTKLIQGPKYNLRLICIPKFTTSSTMVLVNTQNLDCEVLDFSSQGL